MLRIATTMVPVLALAWRAFAAEPLAVTNWIPIGSTDAANASPVPASDTVSLAGRDKKGSTWWSVVDPIPLQPDRSVTFSCRLRVCDDMEPRATAQLRIGLYGVIDGTPAGTTRQKDLRGFVIAGGPLDLQWRVELAEHASDSGPLIYAAGLTNRASVTATGTGGRGGDSRVVITLTRRSGGTVTVNGFWADVPFSFEVKPFAGDLTHLRAVAIMRGGKSGDGEVSIGSVRLRPE